MAAVLTAVALDYAGAQRERFLRRRFRSGREPRGPARLHADVTQPLVIVMRLRSSSCSSRASTSQPHDSRASSRMHEMGVRLALGAGSGG